ncbi:uncharacterized protein DSM5745_03863 [Aspergillus mulundensis]|uniref:Uncharacterized protein n=1 Tax=Aspergillus mulundensis TaxID=1810919 RepID=A0A3D8SAZ2_9EURO|nr:hypothetical protein DSM5745_03863 [Aspergillus mulundensis]RDW83537.1 hypothetical protein DSM5745_03863 [Aspergillus mulundensis]
MTDSDEAPYCNAVALAWHMNRFFESIAFCPTKQRSPPVLRTLGRYGQDFNFGSLCDTSQDYGWAVRSAWNMSAPGLPHIVALMYTGFTAGSQLLRSELTAIIRIVHGRLRTSSTRPHTIAPVLMFSIVGLHHIRVIAAFYDGKTRELKVRAPKLKSIDKECDGFYIDLSKWWLGNASFMSMTDVYDEPLVD